MTEPTDLTLEHEKIKIEQEKLKLEREKLQLERKKVYWTGAGVAIPLLIAAASILLGVYQLKKTADDQFKQKLAETIIQSTSPDEGLARATFITEILGDSAPRGIKQHLDKIDPGRFTTVRSAASQKELIKLLSERPQQRRSILHDWRALFPGDEWIATLEGDAAPLRAPAPQ